MAEYTTNFNLEKPLKNEYYDVDIQNRNMDTIDSELKKLNGQTGDVAGVGRTTETIKGNADALAAHSGDNTKHFTSDEKTKLAALEENANNYQHPANHPASMITEDTTHRFVADTEKSTWNAKETPTGAQTKANTAETNSNSYTDTQISGLAGVGRTTETVKKNAEDISKKISKAGDTMSGDLNTLSINMSDTSILKHGEITIIDAEGKLWNAVYNDLAELFIKKDDEDLQPGDVLVWNGKNVEKSKKHREKSVCGVYSDTYGFLLGGDRTEKIEDNLERYAPVGLSGRVRVKVIGDVEVGDLLCSSEIEGVACKSVNYVPGTILGKALENKTNKDIDRVWMLVMNM